MHYSPGYIPKTTLPTRLAQTTATLIDHFFIKVSKDLSTATAGISMNNISDHLPYFICIKNFHNTKPKTKYVKMYPNYNNALSNFKQELQSSEITAKFNIFRKYQHK